MSDTPDWALVAQKLHQDCRALESKLADVTLDRDEWKELYERLNESLASNKRLFSSKLAETIIADQVKRIKFLEDGYSKMQKELNELKETNK